MQLNPEAQTYVKKEDPDPGHRRQRGNTVKLEVIGNYLEFSPVPLDTLDLVLNNLLHISRVPLLFLLHSAAAEWS